MALDEMTREVLGMLSMVTEAEVLEEIATDLSLTDLDDMKGNLKRLYRKIANHINSDDFDVLEDQGLGPLMSMRDKLRVALNLSAGDPDDISPGDDKGNDKVKKEESGSDSDNSDSKSDTSDNDDEFKDALTDLLKPGKKKPVVQSVGVTGPGGVNAGSLAKLRELKLSGAIGEAGEKGKLTYSGLASQIRLAASRGFDENEICAAVIRVITPGLPLRNYLEEQRNLPYKPIFVKPMLRPFTTRCLLLL